jgi:outer membrane protein
MKIRLAVPALAAFLMVPAVWAQGGAAAPATKVGVIDVQVAITSTSEGKQAAAELQSKFAPRQTELGNLQKQLEDIQTRLRTGANTLSDDERAKLSRDGENIQRSYQRKSQDAQDDFQQAQRDIVDGIGRKMIDVLTKYSHDNGYAVILDRSGQSTPVIYAANSTDVTQDIIRLYDQTYPVKASASGAGAAPARPATSRPATPPATKPQQ